LITLPALMMAGVGPLNAIATNKVQAAAATVSATVAYTRRGMVDWREGWRIAVTSFFGGIAGATMISLVSGVWLRALVPILLLVVAGYFLFAPSMSDELRQKRASLKVFALTMAPALGAYDGFFGPGVGSFFLIGFVLVCGLELMKAMGLTKLANAACNMGSLSIFAMSGLIIWPIALVMAIAAFLGAQLGAIAAVHVGPKLVKPMMVIVCCSLAIKLLSDEQNPLRKFVILIV